MRALAALIALVTATTAVAAEVYTWRDKDGKVHYSDVPPTGGTESRRMNAAGTPASAGAARKDIANQDLEFRKRRAESAEAQAKADKERAETEDRKANCENARAQLAALETGQRLARLNTQGEREYLDDEARAQETERARKAVADWCR